MSDPKNDKKIEAGALLAFQRVENHQDHQPIHAKEHTSPTSLRNSVAHIENEVEVLDPRMKIRGGITARPRKLRLE